MAIAIAATGAEAEVHPGTTVEVTPPSVSDGQLMVMFAIYSDDLLTPRVNETGWTSLGTRAAAGGNDRSIAVWSKVASSESGTYTVDTVESVSVQIRARIVVFSGVHADVVDQTTVEGPDTFDSASYDPAAIVTQTANAWVITANVAAGGTDDTFTVPSGYSTVFAHTYATAPYLDAAYKLVASPGSEDPGTWNVTQATRDTTGLTIALKSASETQFFQYHARVNPLLRM